jgi:hypothetical protein
MSIALGGKLGKGEGKNWKNERKRKKVERYGEKQS